MSKDKISVVFLSNPAEFTFPKGTDTNIHVEEMKRGDGTVVTSSRTGNTMLGTTINVEGKPQPIFWDCGLMKNLIVNDEVPTEVHVFASGRKTTFTAITK